MGDEGKKTVAVIMGSAPCGSWENLKRYDLNGAYIIAADGGRIHAEQAGLSIDWYTGDGDSGGSAVGLSGEVLPAEKDVTDLEAAIQHALALSFQRILMWGVSGGRGDHHLANLQMLEQIALHSGNGLFLDEVNEVRYLGPGHFRIPNSPPYRYLGLIPLDAHLYGVSIQGTKYMLHNTTVVRGSTRTVSNEILSGSDAQITIGKGAALLVRSVPIREKI